MKEKQKLNDLTQKYLKECLDYDPETGIFIWKERPLHHFKDGKKFKAGSICNNWNSRYSNKCAGTINGNGYIQFYIKNKVYLAHRLAFLYMEGYWPEYEMDHIDKDPSNNKWDNLRHVSRMCNMQNITKTSKNTTGVSGLIYNKNNSKHKKWSAVLYINNGRIFLGSYATFDDAVLARYNEEQSNNSWGCSTETSAEKYLKERNLI